MTNDTIFSRLQIVAVLIDYLCSTIARQPPDQPFPPDITSDIARQCRHQGAELVAIADSIDSPEI